MKFTDEEWEEYLKEYQSDFEGDPDHLRVFLERGVEGWNQWRRRTRHIRPDLSHVNFQIGSSSSKNESLYQKIIRSEIGLIQFDHKDKRIYFNLSGVNFNDTNLEHAALRWVDLSGSYLGSSNLQKAKFKNADLRRAYLQKANLTGADLFRSNLTDAVLNQADLRGTILIYADFTRSVISDIKYRNEIKLFGMVLWVYNTIRAFHGINVESCIGNQVFRRFAMDQDFIETFKKIQPAWLYRPFYYLWKGSSNCGQSMLLWIMWSLLFAIGFAGAFYWMGMGHFDLNKLPFNLQSMIYYSVVTFTTLGFGDIIPKTNIAAWVVMAEVITGYIMLGGLISIFSTKLARRS